MIKKILTTIVAGTAMLLSSAPTAEAKGLNELGIFNHLGVSAHAATTGFGFELATPITNYVALRAGASFMPDFSFNTTVQGVVDERLGSLNNLFDMDVKGGLKRTQANVIFNVYPFGAKNAFYVAAGAYFGGKTIVNVTGHTDQIDRVPDQYKGDMGIEIGDYIIPVDKNGNAHGELRVNGFRPYLGLGFGRAVPTRRVNFGVELGVQFMGHMTVWANGDELFLEKSLDNHDDWKKWMDKLTVYPVLKFTISGRIF